MSPEEISAKVLNAMQQVAQNRLQREVTKAVITVPAYFNNTQKQATRHACEIAGLDCQRIINEPTAAAMACGFHNADEEMNVVVFDFGGGTFDVSVLNVQDGLVDVLATNGDMNLGGRDLDEILVAHCIQEFQKQTQIDLSGDKRARARLQTVCEQAKKQLSTSFEAQIRVLSLSGNHNFELRLEKSEFEDLVVGTLERVKEPLKKALEDAELSNDEINKVVLVGGSSRIPWIKDWLK